MSQRALLESVADAVAAGEAVDWGDVEQAAADTGDADLISQLRIISGIGATRNAHASPGSTLSAAWSRVVGTGVAGVLAIAIAQLALAILGARAAPAHVTVWPYIVNGLIFGVGGVVLLAGGGRDRRLPLLGALFLTIGSAFAVALVPSSGSGLGGTLAAVLRSLLPDAFLALMLWRFVREFPVDTQRETARRIASIFVNIAFGIGAVLFAINAIGWLAGSTTPAWFMVLFDLVDRDHPEGVYWPLLFVVAAPAVPFLLWKSRFEAYEDHRRVMLFVGGLAIGLTPFVLAVVATPFVPALQDLLLRQRVGVVLHAALASVVPITAYSVAVDRVMDLQFLVRVTLQYALARYAVWVVSLGPLFYLAFDIHANQQLTIAEYLERSLPAGPLTLSTVGLIMLVLRQHLLRAIDRWFLIEPADQSQTLARLEQRYRSADSLRGVTGALAEELSQTLHAESVAVLLLNDDGSDLVPVEGTTGPLRCNSALFEIVRSTRGDVQLDSRAMESIARLLPLEDREWLDDTEARLLSPLVGSTGLVLGLVAIGEARTGLPYSPTHLTLVTAASGRAAVQIENRRLRGREAEEARLGRDSFPQGLDWQDEPAVYCPACSLVWSPETSQCSCGVAPTVAALPLFVQGKFRLERLVGAGGMGVVYLAVDMVLDRQVAIKTLPSLRSEAADRLHREARTMATVLHPNLALIYGTEQWRGTPMLIVEYLGGGTLRDWMRSGPISYTEAIDLGIVLADVLHRVHASGVLHRDVKPSNIGYTCDGRPKLLDFGLALLDGTRGSIPLPKPLSRHATEALAESEDPAATVTVGDRLVGTPLYLAPEALFGARPQPSFDLWGLALVLYEAIAGQHPFAAADVGTVLAAAKRAGVPDIRDYRPTCPAGLATFLRDALSSDIEQRPKNASAMRHELHRLRAGTPEHAH